MCEDLNEATTYGTGVNVSCLDEFCSFWEEFRAYCLTNEANKLLSSLEGMGMGGVLST